MHSRIFGIEKVSNLVLTGHVDLLPLYEADLPDFADYVQASDLDKDYTLLLEILSECKVYPHVDSVNHEIVFMDNTKENYFKAKFKNILKLLLEPNSFKRFCGEETGGTSTAEMILQLSDAVEDKDSIYVADSDGIYYTLDEFMRTVEYGESYRIFESVDYHS